MFRGFAAPPAQICKHWRGVRFPPSFHLVARQRRRGRFHLLAEDCEETNCFSAFVVPASGIEALAAARKRGKKCVYIFLEATRQCNRTSRGVFIPLLRESSGGQQVTFS